MFITLSPKEIRYTQDSISSCFQNGNEIQDLISDIIKGQTTINEIRTIRVFLKDEKHYSVDNRRLYVFKEVQRLKQPYLRIGVKLIDEADFDAAKFTTTSDGLYIKVRKGPTNRVPKHTTAPTNIYSFSASPRRTYEESPRTTYEESPRTAYEESPRTAYEESPRTTYEESPRPTYEASTRTTDATGSSFSSRYGTDNVYRLETPIVPNIILEEPTKPTPEKSDDRCCVIL
ncbi:uncharacterized protein LOC115211823 [Octopus sinensis]|uniref:Uncharacterized protein LOC115211823 n=1 Tax=Octopus sinensis TaxID=2607531 RepID=A0A7E6EVB9_9MOLL|nr:uncharacterized protein LOC115211823 [Octopus sinensis]